MFVNVINIRRGFFSSDIKYPPAAGRGDICFKYNNVAINRLFWRCIYTLTSYIIVIILMNKEIFYEN